MKKTILSLVFSLFAVVICAVAFGGEKISASAANDLSISVEQLTVADSSYTQAGDFKVTLSVANNSGIATSGLRIFYDAANFTPVMSEENSLHYVSGPVYTGALVICDYVADQGMYAIASLAYSNNRQNGAMITVYLRRNANSTSIAPITNFTLLQLCNDTKEDVACNVSQYCEIIAPVQYVVGDANVSGGISIFDSTYIKRMIANANGTTITAANYQNYLLAHEVGDFVCSFDAIDVNGDGVLTEADALIIETTLAGQGATGNIYDGCSVYYVISTVNPTAA